MTEISKVITRSAAAKIDPHTPSASRILSNGLDGKARSQWLQGFWGSAQLCERQVRKALARIRH